MTPKAQTGERTYYKVAQPDGFDFYTGRTINYRESIGRVVRVPTFDSKGTPVICTSSVIHASKQPIQALGYGKIPCSLFRVEGKPVVEDTDKAGFKEFVVAEEIPEDDKGDYFGLKWDEVLNPFDPRKVSVETVTDVHLSELKTYTSVWASVQASVWDSVQASVWDSEASYVGSLFTQIKKWKYTEKVKARGYPFQSCVNLIKAGLVPATDGKQWFLVGFKNEKARVLWSGKP